MAVDVHLEIDKAQMKKAERLLEKFPKEMRTYLAESLNRAVGKVRTETAREVTRQYTVPVSYVKQHLHVRKAYPNLLEAELSAKSLVMPMYGFKVLPKGIRRRPRPAGGLRVEIKRGSVKAVQHAFIEQMASGHTGVFSRLSGAKRTPGKRAPIKELFSPDMYAMVNNKAVLHTIEREAQATLNTRLDHAIALLEKRLL